MVKVAILGLGIVGGGVADIIEKNQKTLSLKLGGSGEKLIGIKYVLDRRTSVGHGLDGLLTTDYDKIINDDEVSVVIETMGGIHPAYEFTKKALESGKSVVTSNKAVVSAYGKELVSCARANNTAYLFEASVGGGIPIIRPLLNCLASNQINSVYGILNGTTNFILTEMEKTGVSFEAALSKAQELGYAEADPTADVSGADTARKICILANIAFNMFITHDDISYNGIGGITIDDIICADKLGYKIKLLGFAERKNDKAEVFTAPMLIDAGSPLALVSGEYNAININGNAVGDILLSGKGAGALPTASAVTADIIEAISCTPKYPCFGEAGKEALVSGQGQYSSYVRIAQTGISRELEKLFDTAVLEYNGNSVLIIPHEKLCKLPYQAAGVIRVK